MGIRENYEHISQVVKDTAIASGRDPEDVTIIAISKTFSAEVVQEAIDCGITLLGENKVQEARDKIPQLKGDFDFHLVGHLQSNKAKYAVKLFNCIHSIDKFSTADKVNAEAEKNERKIDILVEVNTSGEGSKFGVAPKEAEPLCRQLLTLEHLNLVGLMTIGPMTDDKDRIRRSFRMLRELKDSINDSLGTGLRELSMGMSADFPIAIEEGATMVRIGSSIFGARSYT